MDLIHHEATGFASPAEDFCKPSLNLNQYLIKHPASTFFMRVEGKRYSNLGINNGDILVIDRSLLPKTSQIIVAAIEGELNLLRLKSKTSSIDCAKELWGVVTFIIRKV